MKPITFTGAGLDRADRLRADPAALAEALRNPAARLLRLDGLDPAPDGDRLVRDPIGDVGRDTDFALVGLADEGPLFVLLQAPSTFDPPRWDAILALAPAEAAIYAAARALVIWHARHRFCANCGVATAVFRAGWGRCCPNCGAEHFPRVDPVAIMLVEHDGGSEPRVLLARQPRFPPRRFSALAGFVEPGESLEEAVAREVWEEAGVRVRDVRYFASQPWPFPANLMLACTARADSDRLQLDPSELEAAIWVTRAEVEAALAGAADARFSAPPPHAIACDLLIGWCAGG